MQDAQDPFSLLTSKNWVHVVYSFNCWDLLLSCDCLGSVIQLSSLKLVSMRKYSFFSKSKSQTVIVLSRIDNICKRSLWSLLFRSQKEKLAIIIPDRRKVCEVFNYHAWLFESLIYTILHQMSDILIDLFFLRLILIHFHVLSFLLLFDLLSLCVLFERFKAADLARFFTQRLLPLLLVFLEVGINIFDWQLLHHHYSCFIIEYHLSTSIADAIASLIMQE